ncbi:Death-associated protein kinase 3 [Porphyridium purpureum]|uniref:Death-associated protein kinase 3 n=1 Tax=Porphyridium purpureum TaxID=35688 RepID=A0A5J4Z8U9_PORPP|nr:Death-associated protein kinase 3 [Porphyridium purpureum]|eukprot:POR5847..scf295_1
MEKGGSQLLAHGGWLDQGGLVEVRRLTSSAAVRGTLSDDEDERSRRCVPFASCTNFFSSCFRVRRYAVLEHGVLSVFVDEKDGSRLKERVKLLGMQIEADLTQGVLAILPPEREGRSTGHTHRDAFRRGLALYFDSKMTCQEWYEALLVGTEYVFEKHYEIGAVLGSGAYAQVRLCKDRLSKQRFAVKTVKFSRGSASIPRELQNELAISLSVHHENIVELKDLFIDLENGQVHMVFEHARGGALKDYVSCDLPESAVKEVVRQILRGVQYLHRMKVCHRDLKLTNVLLDLDAPSADSDGKGHCELKLPSDLVKLIDFGLSKHSDMDALMMSCVGSPRFIAPEVIAGKPYTHSADLWSVGVITYTLLSGGLYPVTGESKEELFARLESRTIEPMEGDEWLLVSDAAKQFVGELLNFDPKERLSAEEALEHEWLASAPVAAEKPATDL